MGHHVLQLVGVGVIGAALMGAICWVAIFRLHLEVARQKCLVWEAGLSAEVAEQAATDAQGVADTRIAAVRAVAVETEKSRAYLSEQVGHLQQRLAHLQDKYAALEAATVAEVADTPSLPDEPEDCYDCAHSEAYQDDDQKWRCPTCAYRRKLEMRLPDWDLPPVTPEL